MIVNVEACHARWLAEMREFSWEYLGKMHGTKNCLAAIIEIPPEAEELVYVAKYVFSLPAGSDLLALQMARFAKCSDDGGELLGVENLAKALPEATFCLNSLLLAAFPRNTRTGVIKMHDGAAGIGRPEPEHYKERGPHVAFAGVGVIMMEKVRDYLAPLATDDNVTMLANSKYIAIFG